MLYTVLYDACRRRCSYLALPSLVEQVVVTGGVVPLFGFIGCTLGAISIMVLLAACAAATATATTSLVVCNVWHIL